MERPSPHTLLTFAYSALWGLPAAAPAVQHAAAVAVASAPALRLFVDADPGGGYGDLICRFTAGQLRAVDSQHVTRGWRAAE